MPKDEAPKYNHASHTDKVLKAAKVRGVVREVLFDACRRADFKKPETTFTKAQIMDTCHICRHSVQKALRVLKAEGILTPIANEAGGAGKAVTYRIGLPKDARTSKTDPEEMKRFNYEISKYGYTEAKARQDRRLA